MAKKWILGQKTAFSAQNSAFFYATPMKPPFFRLGRSRLNGIISPPYPAVTLDNFGFPGGGRLAAWRAVSWPRLPKVALLGSRNAVFGPKAFFCGQPCKGFNRKMLSFWCPVMMVTKNLDDFRKKWISGQKTAFLARNSAFFYATPMKPPFFGVRRTRLNGIISPPYPEVTLDTFGFPVGGRFAVRRAFFRHRLPKVALFGPKSAVFDPKSIFLCTSSNLFVTIMTIH